MTFTVDTTPETEALLRALAERRGTTLEKLAEAMMLELLEEMEDAAIVQEAEGEPTRPFEDFAREIDL